MNQTHREKIKNAIVAVKEEGHLEELVFIFGTQEAQAAAAASDLDRFVEGIMRGWVKPTLFPVHPSSMHMYGDRLTDDEEEAHELASLESVFAPDKRYGKW